MAGLLAIGMMAVGSRPQIGHAADDQAALARAFPDAIVPLQQGITASEHEGKPISGKYELEDGALQLSVYVAKDGNFTEIRCRP
jgi:hypothetical protein